MEPNKIIEKEGELSLKALCKLKNFKDAAELIPILSTKRISDTSQRLVIKALGRMKAESSIPYLTKMLDNERFDYMVKIDVAIALNKMNIEIGIKNSLTLLSDEKKSYAGGEREHIAYKLGSIRSSYIAHKLFSIVKNPRIDGNLRKYIAQAVGETGSKEIIPELLKSINEIKYFEYKSVPENLLYLKSDYVVIGIIQSLGKLKVIEAVPDLLIILRKASPHWRGRTYIIRALAEIKSKIAIDDLLTILRDEESEYWNKLYAAYALGVMNINEGIDWLNEMLHFASGDYNFQERIAFVLGKIKSETSVEPLISFLEDSYQDRWVKGRVALSLARMKITKAVPYMFYTLNEEINSNVVEELGEALAEMNINQEYFELILSSIEEGYSTTKKLNANILFNSVQRLKMPISFAFKNPEGIADFSYLEDKFDIGEE